MARVRLHLLAALLALGALVAASGAHAVTFYAIDNYYDALVTIESSTGAVTQFSEIAGMYGTPRLAYLNGTIYALNLSGNCSGSCSAPYLQGVDPVTGATTGLWSMTVGGDPANCWIAEALTSDGNQLIVSVNQPPPTDACNGQTKRLAVLSPTGELSNASARVSESADFDHLSMSPSGQLYGIDQVTIDAVTSFGRIYRVALPSTYDVVGDIALDPYEGIRGTTFTPDGQLWLLVGTGASNAPRRLLRVDPNSGATLEAVTVQLPAYPQMVLHGLVYVPLDPTPARTHTWGSLKSRYR